MADVLLPRAADRASRWTTVLREAGFTPRLVPLIDFERGDADALSALPGAVDACLGALRAGDAEPWLVITSITTVRALLDAGALGRLREASLRTEGPRLLVAAVGSASAAALRGEGLPVDVVPSGAMNAEGLLDLASGPARTVFLPQADIAAPRLREGLAERGWDVHPVIAYRTVDAPARPELRLDTPLSFAAASTGSEPASGERELTPAEAKEITWAAAIATSPSTARGLARLFGEDLPPVISIGPSTSAELASLGCTPLGEAASPSPEAVVDLLQTIRPAEHRSAPPEVRTP